MSISSVNGVASTVSRYRFVASGGETSLSGADANGSTLSYLAGKEEVYLNGVLLVRGQDYTGNDGATISSLTALVAGDTVEIITFVPFAIPTAISSSAITSVGDLLVGTGASAVTRLGVGSSGTILTSNGTTPAYTSTITGTLNNGTLTGTLTAASTSGTSGQYLQTTGSGVQWATVSAGANWSLQNAGGTTLTGAQTITVSGLSSVDKIMVIVNNASSASANSYIGIRLNGDTASNYYNFGGGISVTSSLSGTLINYSGANSYIWNGKLSGDNTSYTNGFAQISGCNSAGLKIYTFGSATNPQTGADAVTSFGGGYYNSATVITSVSVYSSVGNFDAGTIYVYTSA